MEATPFTFPSSKPPLSFPSQTLAFKSHFKTPLSLPNSRFPSTLRRRRNPPATILAAISRTKKEETVETVKHQLQDCHLLAGIKYKGLSVKQLQDVRKLLPESTSLLVAKNTLVYKAIEGTQWEVLKPCMTGMNAWLFVHTEEIPAALKPYRDFQKEGKLEENDFAGAVFEGKFYAPEEFKALETLPTKVEIYAKLLGSLKSPASAVVSTVQAPARNLVMV
jgi:large subunit ribosomal protein L10